MTYYDTYACRSFAGFSGISASFTGDASLANGLPTATRTAVFSYDSEGRLYSDSSRDIESITYAPNDMPMTIFGPYGRIKTQYAYAADGRKLSVAYGHNYTSSVTDTRYYVGPIEFVKSSGANSKLTLQRVNLPWGFFDSEGSPFVNLTDYQGNIRAVTRMSDVVDWTDYYPYGLPKATSATSTGNRYKYSGKEFETRGGLDFYDFDARLQLPTTGLFSRPDPKAWDYPGYNPYLYCAANPIMLVDPTGMDGVRVIDKQNKTITVRANYYAITQDILYKGSDGKAAYLPGYTPGDIDNIQNDVNQSLNSKFDKNTNSSYAGIVTEGEYMGYQVTFDLRISDGGSQINAEIAAQNDSYSGIPIGNTLRLGNEQQVKSFGIKEDKNGNITYVGGVTEKNKNIVMNVIDKNFKNLLHELFHTLGFTHPKNTGGTHGIMKYPPQNIDQEDINEVGNSSFLPAVIL
ncbi:MAG: hypothetical protein K2I64_04505 [Muribaculaceae bacterium]|nr:hypothetical protein [Muribaculaceae bacterium]